MVQKKKKIVVDEKVRDYLNTIESRLLPTPIPLSNDYSTILRASGGNPEWDYSNDQYYMRFFSGTFQLKGENNALIIDGCDRYALLLLKFSYYEPDQDMYITEIKAMSPQFNFNTSTTYMVYMTLSGVYSTYHFGMETGSAVSNRAIFYFDKNDLAADLIEVTGILRVK